MKDKSDLKWTRISPVNTIMVFSKDNAYYWLGYYGIELTPSEEIDGNLYFVNKKREVIAVWRRNEEELDIYVRSKRELYKETKHIIFALCLFVIFVIAMSMFERLSSRQWLMLWLSGIVAFFIFMGGTYVYTRLIKKERW